jgi:hypothetical protein
VVISENINGMGVEDRDYDQIIANARIFLEKIKNIKEIPQYIRCPGTVFKAGLPHKKQDCRPVHSDIRSGEITVRSGN